MIIDTEGDQIGPYFKNLIRGNTAPGILNFPKYLCIPLLNQIAPYFKNVTDDRCLVQATV